VLLGQQTFDLLVRLDEPYRENLDAVRRLTINLPDGGATSLGAVADVYRASGPNTINRETGPPPDRRPMQHVRTRLVDVVRDIKTRLQPIESSLPTATSSSTAGSLRVSGPPRA